MLADFVPVEYHAYIAMALIAVMFVGFIKELYPTEVIALSGAAF